MKIYIPSYGRPDPALHATYHLFSQHADCEVVAATTGSVPAGLRSQVIRTPHVGAARAAIAKHARDTNVKRYIVADDDLKLYKRVDDKKFVRVEDGSVDVDVFLDELELFLDSHAHGGVQQRFMAHTSVRGHIFDKRYLKLAAYNTELMPVEPKFRLRVHEDIDAQLQLAAMGCSAFLMTEWAIDDLGQYKPGGCQRYRTPEVEEAEFQKLRKYHPKYVSFINGRSRVAWQKAYNEGAE